jgi:hypothetical protein
MTREVHESLERGSSMLREFIFEWHYEYCSCGGNFVIDDPKPEKAKKLKRTKGSKTK